MPQSNHRSENLGFMAELRAKDYERYLLCLFSPAAARDGLAALFLFNAELAQIRDQVTEPLLGEIRLQWWREGLEKLGTPEQPPHRMLNVILGWRQQGLELNPLFRLIESRAADLVNPPFPNIAAYQAYRSGTSRPLAAMAAALLGQTRHGALYEQALENYAAAGLVLSVPHWLRRRQMPLPPEWLATHKIDAAALAEVKPQAALQDWAMQRARAVLHATQGLREELRNVPKAEKRAAASLWLHNDLAAFHAQRIVAAHGVLFSMAAPSAARLPYLFWRALCG